MDNLDNEIKQLTSFLDDAVQRHAEGTDEGDIARVASGIIVPLCAEFIEKVASRLHATRDSETIAIHYTSLNGLFGILETGSLRLNDTASTNDPLEGTYFDRRVHRYLESCGHQDPFEIIEPKPAFVASFVRPHSERKRRDDLRYWRSYGDMGRGCSIELSSVNAGLQRVLYGHEKLRSTLGLIGPVLDRLMKYVSLSTISREQVGGLLHETLSPLRFLYKPNDYSFEHESRKIVAYHAVSRTDIGLDTRGLQRGETAIRMHYSVKELMLDAILDSGTTITIGPSITNPQHVKNAIEIALHKWGIIGPQVRLSEIAYRATD